MSKCFIMMMVLKRVGGEGCEATDQAVARVGVSPRMK